MFNSKIVRFVSSAVVLAIAGNLVACAAPAAEENEVGEESSAVCACAAVADDVSTPPADGTTSSSGGDVMTPTPTVLPGMARPMSVPGQCIKWGKGIIDRLRKNKKFVAGVGGTFIVIGAVADVKGAIDAIKDLLGVGSGLSEAEKKSVEALLKDIELINNNPGLSEDGKLAAINALLKAAQDVCEKKK